MTLLTYITVLTAIPSVITQNSILCVYKCNDSHWPGFCLSSCPSEKYDSGQNCPLYGWQILNSQTQCSDYQNGQLQIAPECIYHCTNDHSYPNFCKQSSQVCPLSVGTDCDLFEEPVLYPSLEWCNNPPTDKPSQSPIPAPTAHPTPSPTNNPSPLPTNIPSRNPSKYPTKSPTDSPTPLPTSNPTLTSISPSHHPTVHPTSVPSTNPTKYPSKMPTKQPTPSPTSVPTVQPSPFPTMSPTGSPSQPPTNIPTTAPTHTTQPPSVTPSDSPTFAPSNNPTSSPTHNPTFSPTIAPTDSPSQPPTEQPTFSPTVAPTTNPTTAPTGDPTINPTMSPTLPPTFSPSLNPTITPSQPPSNAPSFSPTFAPTKTPTPPSNTPTNAPSITPTFAPTVSPTSPTLPPTLHPTHQPTPGFWPHLVRGYNIFENDMSTFMIIDDKKFHENKHSYISEMSQCSYNQLEFGSSANSSYRYLDSYSASIGASFGIPRAASVGAGNAVSETIIDEQTISEETYFFSMDLTCTVADASIKDYNELYWSASFLKDLYQLPLSYDTLAPYEIFWGKYGTHIVQRAKFGGSIHGVVTADRCGVIERFTSMREYEFCLTTAYKGIEVEQCNGIKDSENAVVSVSDFINKKELIIKGGSLSLFGDIISDFQELDRISETLLNEWIESLVNMESVAIVGGAIDTIHEAINQALSEDTHNLNVLYDIGNETLLEIANAMEIAYASKIQQLQNTRFECALNCYSGKMNDTECICIECGEDKCCGFAVKSKPKKRKGAGAAIGIVIVVVVIIIFAALIYLYYNDQEEKGYKYSHATADSHNY